MKLTKRQLKQIIKEELSNLSEDDVGTPIYPGQPQEPPDVEILEDIHSLCQEIGTMTMGMWNKEVKNQIEEHMIAIMYIAQENM
jgi:DhnA family fructose-bisphosphate aldolase class Ia